MIFLLPLVFFNSLVPSFLSLFATASLAAPLEAEVEAEIEARAPIPSFKVGWGQELQNHDQTNHWVVWVEGESAVRTT